MPPTRTAAFSLAELMIALGVLAIGIAMVAGLFPAAIKQTEFSYNDSVGTIIAQNSLAMAKATLTIGSIPGAVGTGPLAIVAQDGMSPPPFDPNLRAYHDDPAAPTLNDKGFLILGRMISNSEAQLVIVAYAKKNPSANVTAVSINISSISSDMASVSGSIANARRLSPLIMKADGRYAIIEKVEGQNLYLDHTGLNNTSGDAWVIVEAGQSGASPAMAVVTATVALP